jgi:hypothetical protein
LIRGVDQRLVDQSQVAGRNVQFGDGALNISAMLHQNLGDGREIQMRDAVGSFSGRRRCPPRDLCRPSRERQSERTLKLSDKVDGWISVCPSATSGYAPQRGRVNLTYGTDAGISEPVREHIESSESFVIQGRRPDSLGGRRCGRERIADAMTEAGCAIRAI